MSDGTPQRPPRRLSQQQQQAPPRTPPMPAVPAPPSGRRGAWMRVGQHQAQQQQTPAPPRRLSFQQEQQQSQQQSQQSIFRARDFDAAINVITSIRDNTEDFFEASRSIYNTFRRSIIDDEPAFTVVCYVIAAEIYDCLALLEENTGDTQAALLAGAFEIMYPRFRELLLPLTALRHSPYSRLSRAARENLGVQIGRILQGAAEEYIARTGRSIPFILTSHFPAILHTADDRLRHEQLSQMELQMLMQDQQLQTQMRQASQMQQTQRAVARESTAWQQAQQAPRPFSQQAQQVANEIQVGQVGERVDPMSPCYYSDFTPAMAPFMKLIQRMEVFCQEESCSRNGDLIRTLKGSDPRAVIRVFGRSLMDDGVTERPPAAFYAMAETSLNQPTLAASIAGLPPTLFVKFDDQEGIDAGGVSRMLFSKVGEYFRSKLLFVNRRYYLAPAEGQTLSELEVRTLARLCRLSVTNFRPVSLGIPFSFSLLYYLKAYAGGRARNPSKMPDVFDLTGLFRMDDPDSFHPLLSTLAQPEDSEEGGLLELISYHAMTDVVLTGEEIEAMTPRQKYAWFRRVLHALLIKPYAPNIRIFCEELCAFLPSRVGDEPYYRILSRLSLREIANIFGAPDLTLPIMLAVDIVLGGSNPYLRGSGMQAQLYLQDYIRNGNPESWSKLLMYTWGFIDPTKPITIIPVDKRAASPEGLLLVAAHSCFGQLEMGHYDSYEQFVTGLEYSIANSQALGLA